MRVSVTSLLPAFLLCFLSVPPSVAQEATPPVAGDSKVTSVPGQDSTRRKTRFRVLDKDGRPWTGATIVAYSRPCEGMLDRVVGTSSKRGRSSAMLLEGRSYVAWAWSPLEKGVEGEYRISDLDQGVGAGGIITLRESKSTRMRLQIELDGVGAWKAPFRGKLTGTLDNYSRTYFSLDVPIEGSKVTLPVCPLSAASLYVLDAEGRLVGSSHFSVSRKSLEAALEKADERRENLKKAEEEKRKREAAEKAATEKAVAEKAAGKKAAGTKEEALEDEAKAREMEAKAKEMEAKAAAQKKIAQKRKVQQFQVVQLGPLIQGINVRNTVSSGTVTLDYVALGKVKWKLPEPYHFKVRLEDSKTKTPIAHARIYQGAYGMTYELGRSDAKGMAVITIGTKLDAKTRRPKLNNTNFRVQARGYPETYVQRHNLRFPAYEEEAELAKEDVKPLFVSKLAQGFVVKGRVLLTEGKPLARTSLVVMTGVVYDYGNQNQGFNQSGLPCRIETDAEGRFEWGHCDERFVLSIRAILDPQAMASMTHDERFPDSARVILYQGKGKKAKGGGMVLGPGQVVIRGVAPAAPAKPAKDQKKGKDGNDKKDEEKPEEPKIKDIGDIRIDKLAAVCVQVHQADGTPTSHARIGVASQKSGQQYVSPPLHLSNHLGRLRVLLPLGDEYILGAGKRGQALLCKLTVPTKEPIMIRLAGGMVIKGRVVDPNGDPLSGANIYLYPYGGLKVLHQGLWNALRGGNTSTLSKADGTFEIPVHPETNYTFQVNYRRGNQWYNIGQQMVETESSSQDLGDLEIPVPVKKKAKDKDKKKAKDKDKAEAEAKEEAKAVKKDKIRPSK